MARASLPPGFRFHPTDVELILYYLKRKILGKHLHYEAIAELDLYKFSPWDLPDKSCLQSKDLEWYFFCPRNRKHDSGPRANRATENGHWKTTGKDRAICNDSMTVGMRKTLIFHLGRAPHATRTNWVMHEYKLEIKDWIYPGISQDSYVLCKIFEKSGAGPKNGEQHGARFKEEEWDDDLFDNSMVPLPLADSGSPSIILDGEKLTVTEDSSPIPGMTCESSLQQNASSDASGKNLFFPEGFDMDSLFAILGEQNDDQSLNGIDSNEMLELLNNVEAPPPPPPPPPSDDDDIFGGLEDLNTSAKLQGIDLASMEDSYGLNYIELDDLEGPVGCHPHPVEGERGFSIPPVAASGVGSSSGCMFPRNSGVFGPCQGM